MAVLLSPSAKQQFFDNDSNAAAGFLLYTYATGTSTPQATYSNRAGSSANTNPIVLDSRGEATIYLTPGVVYDYVLKTAAGVTVWTRTGVTADAGDADAVLFTPAGTGAVARPMQDKARESLSILDFMSAAKRADVIARTGLYDVSPEILVAVQAAVDAGKALYAPAGLYMWGGTRIAPVLAAGDSVVIYGDGSGATEFREIDGTTINSAGTTILMFYFDATGISVERIEMRGMTINHRGSESLVDVAGSFELQQCHCVSLTAASSGLIKRVAFNDVVIKDKIAGGIVLAAGRMQYVELNDCHGVDYQHNGGQRGDFEFQASIDLLNFTGCTGKYVQSEPNATTPESGVSPVAILDKCEFETVDFGGYDADVDAQLVVFNNSKATVSSVITNVVIKAMNSEFVVDSSRDWRRTGPGSTLTDCTLINAYTAGTDSISPFYPRAEATLGGTYLKLIRCKFRPGEGASDTTTGYAIQSLSVYSGAQPFLVELEDCEFSSLYQRTIDAYRVGNYVFRRCKMAGRDWSVHVGNDATNYGSVTLDTCDFSQVTTAGGSALRVTMSVEALASVTMEGSHDYSDFTIINNSGLSFLGPKLNMRGNLLSAAAPAAGGVAGMRVRIQTPAAGAPCEYVCTTTHATAATWKVAATLAA